MRKILITGGNFINKGAQSMLFCLVDSLKKNYPTAEVVMIDIFPTLHEDQKAPYAFGIVNMHIRTLLRMAFPFLKLIVRPKPISNPEKEIWQHFDTADLVLDISGYGVSSHNQSPLWTFATLFPVILAKKRKVPFVFLPQSIGPFDFKGWKKMVVWPLIKKYLKYPKVIFIREPKCREALSKVRTDAGVIDSFDLVLQSSNLNLDNIYKSSYEVENVDIKKGAIVVIPNKQLTKLQSEETVVSIFVSMINALINDGREVVIVRHSADDKVLCQKISDEVNNNRLGIVNQDLTPNQIEHIFQQSSMVISARYHGLIHALKQKKPCMVIGWAHKYEHVMKSFSLEAYYSDVRDLSDEKASRIALKMQTEIENIQGRISSKLDDVQSLNLFKFIDD